MRLFQNPVGFETALVTKSFHFLFPAGTQDLSPVTVYMSRAAPFFQVTMDEQTDGPFQTSLDPGFLGYKKSGFGSPAFPAQGGGGVKGIQIPGNGKDNRNQIFLFYLIDPQKFVIEGGNLSPHVFFFIQTHGCPAQGKKPFFFHKLKTLPFPY
jgi:hypothetical protein